MISQDPSAFEEGWPLAVWAIVIGLVELLPVPAWRGLTISVGFPLMMVVAFLYQPRPRPQSPWWVHLTLASSDVK